MIEKIHITSIGFYASIEYIDKKIELYLEAFDVWINCIVYGNYPKIHTSITIDDFENIGNKK